MLLEVVKVLSWEPELSVERRRCDGAKNELIDLESLIMTLKDLQDNLSSIPVSPFSKKASNETPSNSATAQKQISNVALKKVDDEDELELF